MLRGSTQRFVGYDVKRLAVWRVFQKLRGVRRQSKIMDQRLKDSRLPCWKVREANRHDFPDVTMVELSSIV